MPKRRTTPPRIDKMPSDTKPENRLKMAKFAALVIKGKQYWEAGLESGLFKSESTARSYGGSMAVHPFVVELIKQAEQNAMDALQADVNFVIGARVRIARANMQDYISVQKDGSAYINLSKLTREQADAISEITSEEYTEGRGPDAREIKRTKIKLHDKQTALAALGKYLGIDKERIEHSGGIGITVLADDIEPMSGAEPA